MRASTYHEEWGGDEFMDKVSEYTLSYPIADETLADLDWATPEDELFFYQDLEEHVGMEIPERVLDGAFGGELKVAQLSESLCGFLKEGRLSTQTEKIRAKTYRMANKAQLARKAKRRRRQQASGMKLKSKRIGSSAAGYSFIAQAPTPKAPAPGAAKLPAVTPGNFSTNKQLSSVQKNFKWKGM